MNYQENVERLKGELERLDSSLESMLRVTFEQQWLMASLGVIPSVEGQGGEDLTDRWTNELCSKLVGEVVELQQVVAWKTHRVVRKDPDKESKILDELVDCLKYLLVIADLRGVTANDLVQHFRLKTITVMHRAIEKVQERETKNGE